MAKRQSFWITYGLGGQTKIEGVRLSKRFFLQKTPEGLRITHIGTGFFAGRFTPKNFAQARKWATILETLPGWDEVTLRRDKAGLTAKASARIKKLKPLVLRAFSQEGDHAS